MGAVTMPVALQPHAACDTGAGGKADDSAGDGGPPIPPNTIVI